MISTIMPERSCRGNSKVISSNSHGARDHFELVEYVAGEKFTVKARKNYWRQGADGQPLPYLDQVISIDVKSQSPAYVAGLVSDQFDVALGMDYSAYRTLKEQHPDIVLSRVRSAGTLLFRAHVDTKPFDDERVRLALKLCQDRKQIMDLALATLRSRERMILSRPRLILPGILWIRQSKISNELEAYSLKPVTRTASRSRCNTPLRRSS